MVVILVYISLTAPVSNFQFYFLLLTVESVLVFLSGLERVIIPAYGNWVSSSSEDKDTSQNVKRKLNKLQANPA